MSWFDYSLEEIKALREKVIEFFGSRCMNPNCLVPGGCSDKRCLQIDHIQAIGKDRLVGAELYLDILESPTSKERYQLLCANCNWIKKHDKKETRGNVTNSLPKEQRYPINPIKVHISIEQEHEPRYSSLSDIEKRLNDS